MGIGTGIMLIGQLDTKLCYKFANLATLLYGSGNPAARTLLKCHHSIPYPPKHGYMQQHHVPMLIRSKVMLKFANLATLFYGSGNPVLWTAFKVSPFDSSSPKTWV